MIKNPLSRLLLLIFVVANAARAQSVPVKKDIPTIARSAKAAIVTILMANDDKPIARGTGFLVRPDGAIVTNYHVITTGNAAVVKFADGTISRVDGVLTIDKVHDLALIKIHGNTFPTLTLGNSDNMQVGEEVVAIGNPLGLELTVSNGILSGIRSDEKEGVKLLQITAPISRGSSGGPLFNMGGEVIGINAMSLEGGESLNFAIPVNSVKNLLRNQSAQLQQLPQEPGTDNLEPEPPKPDGATRSPSDAASSRKKEPDSVDSSPRTATPSYYVRDYLHDTYYVRAYQHGIYVIDYGGRQLAAACRETLSWPDGIDEPGRPTQPEHRCMHLKVGEHIRPEKIWIFDKDLSYCPFAGDDTKTQWADVLDIVAEAPIGSPLQKPAAPRTSPEILKTLHWIQNTLADGEGRTLFGKEIRESLLSDVNGCEVTFVDSIRDGTKETFHSREHFNLKDLDPASFDVFTVEHDDLGPLSMVDVYTTDRVPTVRLSANDRHWLASGSTVTSIELELPSPYAARFAKALKHAITLCGGKPSAF
jgi:hypothetical protein